MTQSSLETHYTFESVVESIKELTSPFKMILIYEGEDTRLAWPLWLHPEFVKDPNLLKDVIKDMVKCEKGLSL